MKNKILSWNLKSISHELRTPLAGILGITEVLRQESLTETQYRYVEDIRRAGEQLLVAINDLFGEAGRKILNIEDRSPKDKNILLVEDEPLVQKVHGMMLRKIGCIFDTATNGYEALNFFRNNHYDAIIMDIGLPDISGIEVAARIRNFQDDRIDIPIIALTADVTKDTHKRCLDAGINAVATKPIDSGSLSQLLQRWVH